jgi:hypothetical protein
MVREGRKISRKEILRQLRRSPSPTSPLDGEEETAHAQEEIGVTLATESTTMDNPESIKRQKGRGKDKMWREPQASSASFTLLALESLTVIQLFEIFGAIERKDDMFLMEVRDQSFHVSPSPACQTIQV